ncbi:uncharacterized protein LOC131247003 [Magnolia sinica]|uniref:uncharacterized protein LOC131247003 n=1 Tax=Magnolia sinica TaxID=86752 RepID=UPI00265973BF|nr:uncharacterized protein LOC131247003 [Magnolia sinica]
MAEWAAVPSCAQLHLQRSCFKASDFMPHNVYFKILDRKHFRGKCRHVRFPSQEVCELGASLATTWKGSRQFKELPSRCCCLGTLIHAENVTSISWIPIVDQVLLMATVAFAYMAGVIPSNKVSFNGRKSMLDQDAGTSSSTPSGSAVMSKNQINSEFVWDEVKGKLLDALDAIEPDGNLDNRVVECENNNAMRPLSFYAIADGPRLRLLWATLQRLEKEAGTVSNAHLSHLLYLFVWMKDLIWQLIFELDWDNWCYELMFHEIPSQVNTIPGMNEAVNRDVWLAVLSETIQASLQPLCLTWLEDELCLENKKLGKDLFTKMFERLKGDDTILQNIKRLGKEDLFADLLFFLRFGSLRIGCHYDSKILTEHGVDILEDLVITLADGITSLYLELISVDSNMSSEMNSLGLSLCSLSTRALQRLRNEVALKQWMHQNIESVVSMYEDRFDLCTLRTQLLEDPKESRREKLRWWKKLTFQKPPAICSPLCYVVISHMSLPVKRTKELRALTGWRYYFSLYLELSDITMPLVRTAVAKVSSAVSFFLVSLIGRSIGLIYTGIRQALGWK